MQVITDQVTVFSKDNKPCATAKPGEVLLFKTLDCFSNRIPDEQTTMADLDYSYGFANPAVRSASSTLDASCLRHTTAR